MVRQYIGARYVPKFFENPNNTSEWLPNTIYEPLTIVTYGLNSYTSKKTVPASVGDPSNNPDYWVATGNMNAFIDEIQREISDMKDGTVTGSLQNQINTVNDDIDDMKDGTVTGSLQNQINTVNDDIDDMKDGTVTGSLQNQINDISSSMLEVAYGPEFYPDAVNITDHAIHQLGSFTLEANVYYAGYIKVLFVVGNDNNSHMIELCISQNSALTDMDTGRGVYESMSFVNVQNTYLRPTIKLPIVGKYNEDITYYVYVRDQTASNSVMAYGIGGALNFD